MTPPPLHWQVLEFNQLSNEMLYAILKIRQEVFAIEQNSVYLDVDGKDLGALHVLAHLDDAIFAYSRVLAPGVKYTEASIGRVLTAPQSRGSGAGKLLMQRSIQCCEQHYPSSGIRISAQLYLQHFYESFGFSATSEPYDEDGIAHIEMLKP